MIVLTLISDKKSFCIMRDSLNMLTNGAPTVCASIVASAINQRQWFKLIKAGQ